MDLVNSRNTKFESIYERNVELIYKVCFMYVKNSIDAEDLTQNIFMKYLKYEPSFESFEHEKAWFIKVSSNICKNHFKSWWNKNAVYNVNKEEKYTDKEDETLKVILSLPNKYKILIYMYYYEGYKSKEISKILGMNESTIRTNLSKARVLLKEKIGSEL